MKNLEVEIEDLGLSTVEFAGPDDSSTLTVIQRCAFPGCDAELTRRDVDVLTDDALNEQLVRQHAGADCHVVLDHWRRIHACEA